VAIIYNAQLAPTKIDLIAAWVPTRPWWSWGTTAGGIEAVGAYRFDDPAGEVGIETHLLRVPNGPIIQLPLTYRGAPLEGVEHALVGTTEHSVLGTRWVYDACSDPIYANALARTILTGAPQAELQVASESGFGRRELTTIVTGSGTNGPDFSPVATVTTTTDAAITTIRSTDWSLELLRLIDPSADAAIAPAAGANDTLMGRWPGNDVPALLALARWMNRAG
jgi:hypothetical protein